MGTKTERERLEALAAELERATHEARVGDYEGDEFGGGECVLFFSGDDSRPAHRRAARSAKEITHRQRCEDRAVRSR